MLELTPLTECIGTRADGVDVRALSDDQFERIYEAWIDSTIILFRGQTLTPHEQVALSDRFGQRLNYTRPQFAADDVPDILVLSNLTRDGAPIGSPVSGRVWHTDGHYLKEPPAGSLLYAIETPAVGGDTLFANMIAAYDALPARTTAMIEDLAVIISRFQSRPYNYPDRPPPGHEERIKWPDMPQPMVRTHPVSGRKAIYAGGNVPWRVVGMDEAQSAPIVTFVQEFSIQARFTYRHRWQPGDIIVWDNRSAMHRATPYDPVGDRRLMHRTSFGERRA
jgi:taurine dioxygenase/putative 2-oxoglutarate oxygenase